MSESPTSPATRPCVKNTIRTVQPNEHLEVTVFRSLTPERLSQLGDMKNVRDELERIQKVARHLVGDFADVLTYLMDAYRNISAVELSSRCDVSNKTIGHYRSKGYPLPDLYHVLALCIGLNLHPDLSRVLIQKAGYSLNTGTSLHRFLQYLIDNHYMETLDIWNERIRLAGYDVVLPKK